MSLEKMKKDCKTCYGFGLWGIRDIYGTPIFEELFVIKKWRFTKKFPFIKKVLVWQGSFIEAQREINKAYSKAGDLI